MQHNQPNKRHTQSQKQQNRLISVFVLNWSITASV